MGDGQPHMTKSAPCYSVSWDLGKLGLDPHIPARVAPGPSPQSQQLDHLISETLLSLLCRLSLDCTHTLPCHSFHKKSCHMHGFHGLIIWGKT